MKGTVRHIDVRIVSAPYPSMFRRLFSLKEPIDRRFYSLMGFLLMTAKYACDAAIVYAMTGAIWTPLHYVSPLLVVRDEVLKLGPSWLTFALALWTLPFLWIGVSMTIRRAADAGHSSWLGLLFFVPVVNYFFMVYLAFTPTKRREMKPRADAGVDDMLQSALLGVAGGVFLSLGMIALSVLVLRSYGISLFLGTPFIIGATSGWIFNRRTLRSRNATLGVAMFAILISGCAVLLFMLEGAVCIMMATPLAFATAVLGALVGRSIASTSSATAQQTMMVFLVLPVVSSAEAYTARAPMREVLSEIEVDAPPQRVWPNVIGFSELPPPSELVFALGIAYPVRAQITGRGPGAIRRCEFSTGAFVEPITDWDEPKRLAFDVASQPPPMTEWSPYRHVFAPHLDGYMRSRRGEFRLIALPGDRTRIEARTWYELEIFPSAYWSVIADALVGDIHHRVLAHIKSLSEG
jgi:uncharacterized membrane protein YhaH (DUF805 family)